MQIQPSTTSASKPDDTFQVALVCMPFSAAFIPSIQLGLLAAIAEQAGFSTDAYQLNLDLTTRLSLELYEQLCNHRGHMTSEWLFSLAAFGKDAHRDDEAYFNAFPEEITWAKEQGVDAAYLSHLRHEVLPRYIEDCLEMVDWGSYQIIGFSSTFQQNVASLALARRIKQHYPAVKILFGGANFEGEMGPEYVRAFPFIDYAIVGEGDIAFPALLRSLAASEKCVDVPGLVLRADDGIRSAARHLLCATWILCLPQTTVHILSVRESLASSIISRYHSKARVAAGGGKSIIAPSAASMGSVWRIARKVPDESSPNSLSWLVSTGLTPSRRWITSSI